MFVSNVSEHDNENTQTFYFTLTNETFSVYCDRKGKHAAPVESVRDSGKGAGLPGSVR